MSQPPLIAGVELGGTKCNCILAAGPEDIRAEARVATTTPAEAMAAIEQVLAGWGSFDALGIASFGPVALDPAAADYGYITATTKPNWSNTDVAGRLGRRFGVPTGFHTDVVGAALAEGAWGAASDVADHAYVTVGTGVGVGLVANGRPVTGMTHAELGHVMPSRLPGDDWAGNCSFHGACIEGLASGPAIAARVGKPAEQLPADHPAWDIVVHTLAQLCQTLALTGIPRRIVMGGGVMTGMPHLFPRIRTALAQGLGGYLSVAAVADLDTYVVPAQLGGRAGPLGAIMLGIAARSAA